VSHRPKATFSDLKVLGDKVSAEIIHGSIIEKANPSVR